MRTASLILVILFGLPSATAQVTKTRTYEFEREAPGSPLVAPREPHLLAPRAAPGITGRSGTLLERAAAGPDAATLAARAEQARVGARQSFRLELRRHQQRCGDSARCPGPAPLPDYRKAVSLLQTLVRRFPRWSGAARALLDLGELLYERGPAHDQKSALRALDRLVRAYPKSRVAPKALLAIAEHHFAQASMHKAQIFYERVLRLRFGNLRPYATYKLGWVHYNLGKFAAAERGFLRVTRMGSSPLRTQAARDLVLALVQRRDWRTVPDFLTRELGRGHALTLLPRLADLYERRGDLRGAKGIYEYLIAEEPSAPKQRDYYLRRDRIERRLGGP